MKTLNLKWFLGITIAALMVVGCSAPVHVEKDNSVVLTRYKSYTWVDREESRTNKSNQLMEQKFKSAVSDALDKQGWRMDNRRPDVLISYDVLVERGTRQQSEPVYSRPYSRVFYN